MTTSKADFLIVGQGLAGSLLAMALLDAGKRVLMLDDGWRGASSLAASGVINPVSGQRLAKDPELEHLLPAALETYKALGKRFGASLIQSKALLRLVQSADELERLKMRRLDTSYQALLGPWVSPEALPPEVKAPLGGFYQQQVYLVDVALLLRLVRDFLQEQGLLIQEAFEPESLAFGPAGLRYGPHQASALVFCEGYRVGDNPWFAALPWQPAKGQSLVLEIPADLPDAILSAGKGLIPLGKGRYRLGSTYERDWQDDRPTTAARDELLAGLAGLLHKPPEYLVLEQASGIRPAAAGSRPLIGRHPGLPSLHLFNGFGSKGVLLIPGYARDFAQALCQPGPLPSHLDLSRHHGLLVAHG